LGIILQSDLNWVDRVNYTAQKAWKALHFVMHVLKQGKRTIKSLAYASVVCPILEYGSACRDLCRGHINVLDQVQNKAAQFTNHTKDSDWETLAQHRMIGHLFALFKTYSVERAWKAIRDGVDHVPKIRDRKQRIDIRKYFFVNRTINQTISILSDITRAHLLLLFFCILLNVLTKDILIYRET